MTDLADSLAAAIRAIRALTAGAWLQRGLIIGFGLAVTGWLAVLLPLSGGGGVFVTVALALLVLGSAAWPDTILPSGVILVACLSWLAGGSGRPLWTAPGPAILLAGFHWVCTAAAGTPGFAQLGRRLLTGQLRRGGVYLLAVSGGCGVVWTGTALSLPGGLVWIAAAVVLLAAGLVWAMLRLDHQ